MRTSSTREGGGKEKEWELRPCGTLQVHKRDDGCGVAGVPVIKVKVSHGTYQHEVSVPAHSTFGELKRALIQETGLQPNEQRLLFRGKEKDDNDFLHIMGIVDMSKIILLEDPASKERKLEELKRNQDVSKACEALANVRFEVDKLEGKVLALESSVCRSKKIEENEFDILTELLMLQLLRLDSIEAEGELKIQRRNEVRRVQSLVETLDGLKAGNSNPFSGSNNSITVKTQWETFESGFGSLNAPSPKLPTKITSDWEVFD